jgi:hypothetical protein
MQVKPSYFTSPEDLLCVLTSGVAGATLKVETPGRCVCSEPNNPEQRAPKEPPWGASPPSLTGALQPMSLSCMHNGMLTTCMLTRPAPASCPWALSLAGHTCRHLLEDRLYVHFEGEMDKANMQVCNGRPLGPQLCVCVCVCVCLCVCVCAGGWVGGWVVLCVCASE